MCRLALLLLFASPLYGDEDRLAAIHALLVPMRGSPIAEARGATPTLTDVKHQLRDWIEFHLSALRWKDARWTPNPSVLQERLNDELSHADLFCPQNACAENRLGHLDRVVLEVQGGFLIVRTSIGVQTCGTDDSAYIYESTDGSWRRIWQSEQTPTRKRLTSRSDSSTSSSHRPIGVQSPTTPST